MSTPAGPRHGRLGYAAVFGLCFAVAVGWLVLGGTAAVVRYWPGLLDAASAPHGGASVLAAAARATEPLPQLVVDYGLSIAGIGAAVVLAVMGTASLPVRLVALALVGSAAAFNLQADAIASVLDKATGLPIAATRNVALHALACAAFVLALLLFAGPIPAARWRARAATPGAWPAACVLLPVAVGVAAPLLPCTVSCVLFFGFLVPAVGVAVLPRMTRRAPTHGQRTQARLVLGVAVAALTTNTVLGLTTLALSALGAPLPTLVAPEPGGEYLGLLFWSSRATHVAIAAVLLAAVLATRLWRAERVVGRGLAVVLTTVLVGGVAGGVGALAWHLGLDGVLSAVLAAAAAGVVFLPVHLTVEGLTDRLLYGDRPTPYRALADISRSTQAVASGGPDLDDVAAAVGQALGAAEVRITVVRQYLPDRTYRWAAAKAEAARPLVAVPIRHGTEQIGTLAVEHAAVIGVHDDRRQLLAEIADGLGGVVAAHRIGIELERQLRAAVAHGAEIARARRQAVSEMDAERRRIERDLHDGVQHHLVSLRLALGLVEFEVEGGRTAAAVERLGALADRLDTAGDVLMATVGGVRSAQLAERGLVAALEAELACVDGVAVVAELPAGRRYGEEVESAVYFCCLESVNNATKHAAGASVVVRLVESDGMLRFTVADDGPGFEQAAEPSGRGLRNLRQRIVAAGGRVDVRSAPGAGTTVEGMLPVPPLPVAADVSDHGPVRHADPDGQATTVLRIVGPERTAPTLSGTSVVVRPRARLGTAAADADRRGAGPGSYAAPDRSLVAEVRALTAAASADLGPAAAADLAAVEAGLRGPVRVGFLDRDGADARALMRCVFPAGPPPDTELVAARTGHLEGLDALVVLDGQGRATAGAPPGTPTIVVVDARPVPEPAGPAGSGHGASTIVPADWRMACAALRLTEADHAALRAGRPVASLGDVGNREALAVARAVDTQAALAAELVRRSGVPALREALDRQVFTRVDLLRGRGALDRLAAIAARLPPDGAAERLRYDLERIRATRHEFAESALLDDLHGGSTALAGPDRVAALRLLGAAGPSATDRLGLPAEAAARAVERAACTELSRWQRIAANPVGPGGRRHAAAVLVRTCERILARHGAAPTP